MNISLAQTEISTVPQQNLETAEKMIKLAVERNAELIVFPEMFMARPKKDQPLAEIAEPLDGPFVTSLQDLATQYGIAVVSGIWEKSEAIPQKAINCALTIDKNGSICAAYHKIHLFDALSIRESDNMVGGAIPPPLFSVGGFTVGLAICYDLRFPELFRYLSRHGVELIIVPSAWYAGPMKEEHWLTLLQARAIENTCYVAGASPCGPPFSGRSTIFDPFGARLADGGEAEALVTASLEKRRIKEVRDKLPCLSHARPDLFAN